MFSPLFGLRGRLPIALTVLSLAWLPLCVAAQASGQRTQEAERPVRGAAAAPPPMSIDLGQSGEARESLAPAKIQVRPLDVRALAPSEFGDWDHSGADQPRQ